MLAVDKNRRRSIGLRHQPSAQLAQHQLARDGQALSRPDRRAHAVAYSEREFSRPAAADVAVKPRRLRDQLEAPLEIADRFRAAEPEQAVRLEGTSDLHQKLIAEFALGLRAS